MIAHLALLFLTPQASPPEVAQFAAAYAARRSDEAADTPDPAISRCLDILLRTLELGLKAHPSASEKEVDRWMEPFTKAVAKPGEKDEDFSKFRSMSSQAHSGLDWRFIIARMGYVTRTVAYDRTWRRFEMPPEFHWSTPWDYTPKFLSHSLMLLDGWSLQAQGNRVPVRLTWLKREGRKLKKVGAFEAMTTLDFMQSRIRGNLVTEHTVDFPTTFQVSMATPVLGRLTTWDCSLGRPRLICVQLLDQPLRAIDRDALAAFCARHPTPLQRRLRRFWPAESEYGNDLSRWTEKRMPGGVLRVVCDEGVVFDLKRGPHGYRVVSVRPVK